MKGQYLIAKPKPEDTPKPKKVKARITEYKLLGFTILTKITFIEEVEP